MTRNALIHFISNLTVAPAMTTPSSPKRAKQCSLPPSTPQPAQPSAIARAKRAADRRKQIDGQLAQYQNEFKDIHIDDVLGFLNENTTMDPMGVLAQSSAHDWTSARQRFVDHACRAEVARLDNVEAKAFQDANTVFQLQPPSNFHEGADGMERAGLWSVLSLEMKQRWLLTEMKEVAEEQLAIAEERALRAWVRRWINSIVTLRKLMAERAVIDLADSPLKLRAKFEQLLNNRKLKRKRMQPRKQICFDDDPFTDDNFLAAAIDSCP